MSSFASEAGRERLCHAAEPLPEPDAADTVPFGVRR